MSLMARLNLTLAFVLVVTILLILSSGRDLSQPNVEYMPDMAYAPAQESFSPSSFFEDGMTLQAPPEGTVARGRIPLSYEATPEDAQRAGRELGNPLQTDGDAAERTLAATAYGIYCQPCHGAGGRGDGPISTRGYPPPPTLFSEKAYDLPDGQIFHIVSYGQGNMPGHASQIPVEDRWRIVNHVRALQDRARAQEAQP